MRPPRPLARTVLGTLLVACLPLLGQSRAGSAGVLRLVARIGVGGEPSAIAVDHCGGRNDILVYSGSKVRFIDGDTLTLASEEISIPSWAWEGWIAYDRAHHQAYVLQVTLRSGWQELLVHVISGRSHIGSFSVNEQWNDPVPQDSYDLDGLAFKQPGSEGNNPGRLIVDNTRGGTIDVIDLNGAGTEAARIQRYAYRAAIEGTVFLNSANTLALETQHETLPIDDLATSDLLYISDANHKIDGRRGYMRVLSLNHPLEALDAVPLPDLDLSGTWPFGNGQKGVATAGSLDRLYVASGLQSFEKGYMGVVDTTDNQLERVVNLLYGDTGLVHVDWYDPRRVFIATYDGFGSWDPDMALYLNLVYDGVVVDRLRLVDGYGTHDLRGMDFDPYLRRLYMTLGSEVFVIQVNYGALPTEPPPLTVSAAIPPSGGTLQVPGGRAALDFPSDAVSQDTTVTYTETARLALGTGDLYAVRGFELSAAISGTTTPVTSFDPPYELVLHYTDAELGGAIESTLDLTWWDGTQWIAVPGTVLNLEDNQLSASLDHMTLFAVLGETNRACLPVVQSQ